MGWRSKLGCMGHYLKWLGMSGAVLWVGEGGWKNILVEWKWVGMSGDKWGWVRVGGDKWGWVHCLIMPIHIISQPFESFC